jgi:hypothetical protein
MLIIKLAPLHLPHLPQSIDTGETKLLPRDEVDELVEEFAASDKHNMRLDPGCDALEMVGGLLLIDAIEFRFGSGWVCIEGVYSPD